MIGSYLYRFTIGKFGFLVGTPIFLLGYAYISGLLLVVFFGGLSKLTVSMVYNPFDVWAVVINYWNFYSEHKNEVDIIFMMKFFMALILPFFIFRIIEAILSIIIKIVTFPMKFFLRR